MGSVGKVYEFQKRLFTPTSIFAHGASALTLVRYDSLSLPSPGWSRSLRAGVSITRTTRSVVPSDQNNFLTMSTRASGISMPLGVSTHTLPFIFSFASPVTQVCLAKSWSKGSTSVRQQRPLGTTCRAPYPELAIAPSVIQAGRPRWMLDDDGSIGVSLLALWRCSTTRGRAAFIRGTHAVGRDSILGQRG